MEIMLSPPVTVIRLTKALTLSWPQYVGTTLKMVMFSFRSFRNTVSIDLGEKMKPKKSI